MTEGMEPEERLEQQLREEYGWLYDRLTEILYAHDIVGLAALESPEDEYSVEVDKFLPLLPEIQSSASLSQVLYEVFVRMFGKEVIPHKSAKFDALAEDVWKTYQSWRNEQT